MFRRAQLGSATSRAAFEHVAVVEKAVGHGGDGRAVAEQFPPVFYRALEANSVLARS